MGAIGKVGSFGTDAVLPDYVNQGLNNALDDQFKYRQEQRLAEATKKANEVKDDWDPKAQLSGNTGINDLVVPLGMESKIAFSDNVRKINSTNNPAEKQRLMQVNNRLKQNFEVANQIPKIIDAKIAEIQKGVEDDKLNPRDAERAAHILDGLKTGKARVRLDEYGNMKLTTYKMDENGGLALDERGNPIVIGDDQDVASLFKSFNVHPNQTYDKDLAARTDKYKLDTKTWETAGNKYTVEQKGEREKANAESFADAVLSQPHNLYELSARTGIPESDKEALKDVIKKDFLDNIAEKDVQNHDYAYDSNARANRKERRELEKETPTIGTGTVSVKEGVIDGTDVKSPQGTKVFAIDKAERKFGDGKIQRLKEVRRKPDGTYQYVVEETFESGSTQSKRPTAAAMKKIADSKGKLTEDDLTKEEFETVTTSNKAPKVIVYDAQSDADDAENFAIMLENPKTNRKFSGLSQANKFFDNRAGAIQGSAPKLTAEELIAKYRK